MRMFNQVYLSNISYLGVLDLKFLNSVEERSASITSYVMETLENINDDEKYLNATFNIDNK